jgi:hypothetical protein
MNTESYYLSVLVKFAFLGGTAGGLLLFWKCRGIKSILLYFLSCANILCFVAWLSINGAVYAMARSPNLRPMIYYGPQAVQVGLVVFTYGWPFVASVAAFCLLVVSLLAQPRELPFIVPANLLMLFLWAFTIVALK